MTVGKTPQPGQLQARILAALRNGPLSRLELSAVLQDGGFPSWAEYHSTLFAMEKEGTLDADWYPQFYGREKVYFDPAAERARDGEGKKQ
jgi:hypothetical protein